MKQLIRFSIVGCMNFAISYSVFLFSYRYCPFSALAHNQGLLGANLAAGMRLLDIPSIDGAVANLLGFAAGMVNSFLWNRFWTFQSPGETRRQAGRFIVTNLACLLVSTASIFSLTDLNHWPYQPVWLGTMLFVTCMNFIVSKNWVFARGGACQ